MGMNKSRVIAGGVIMHTQILMIVIAVALAFSPAVCDELPAGADKPQFSTLAPEPEAAEVPVPTAKPAWRQPPAATICTMIATAARMHAIPARFLTRLIWQESRFRVTAVSHAGAQGIAQFMPATAAERDLEDPFDPNQALWAAAGLLSSLKQRFGNFGLAAAAYNAGPGRVSAWLRKRKRLPAETRNYVEAITGRPASSWATAKKQDLGIAGKSEAETICASTVVAMAD
jgi:soluble lytic murein transglycosylase-like protein